MYAFIENEKIDEKLSFIRDSFLEKPAKYDDYNEEELLRLRALAPKIAEIISEHEKIVNDYYERLDREEAEEEARKIEEEKKKIAHEYDELIKVPQKELVEMYMKLKYGIKE